MRILFTVLFITAALVAETKHLIAPDGTTVIIDRDEYGVPHISYGNDRYDQTTKKPNGYGVCVLTVVVPCTVCPASRCCVTGTVCALKEKSTGWIPSTHEKDIRGSFFLRNDRHSQIKLVPCFHEYGRRFESSV